MMRIITILAALLAGQTIYMVSGSGILRNHLPDLLWALAICQTSRLMREHHFPGPYTILLLLLPFLTEAGQWSGMLPGTYDRYDMYLYTGLYLVFFFKQIKTLCSRKTRVSFQA